MKLPATLVVARAATTALAALSLELTRSSPEDNHGIVKRANFVESIANNITGGGYYIDVTVGTPGQPARMILDTGSSDAWVVSRQADLCTNKKLQEAFMDTCGDTYDPTKSSSYAIAARQAFSIRYLDGSAARGDYIKDDFTIANTTIKGLQIGLATTTGRGTGILGVGFSSHTAAKDPYPNIMDEMVEQKLIDLKAYSLWLNDRRSSTGRILFGGIDTAKFIGPLKVMPMIPDVTTKNITSFTVAMSNMSVTLSNKTSVDISPRNGSSPALLDSGTTLTYLPADMASKVYTLFGVVEDKRILGSNLAFIDCNYLKSERDMVMSFSFANGGGTIMVPVYEMVLDILDLYPGFSLPSLPFKDACLFGIQSTSQFASVASNLASSDFALLGDTFLRSAYVVYNLDHNEIGMAQANLNATDSNVVNLSATESSLPRLTGVASQTVHTQAAATVQITVTGADGRPTVTTTEVPATSSDSESAALRSGGGADLLLVVVASTVATVFGGVWFVL